MHKMMHLAYYMIAKRSESVMIQYTMTRLRLIFVLILVSVLGSLTLMLPGCFRDPRQLVLGESKEAGNLGYVEVSDSTARWRGSNYKGKFRYSWVQTDSEPYTIEVSRNQDKWLVGVTFEDDDHAEVNLYIMDKLPDEAQDFIRQRNRARNRPDDELKLRFRRIKPEK